MEHISKIVIGLAAIYISLQIIGFGIRNVDAEDMGIHSYKLYENFTYKKLINDYVEEQEKKMLQEQYEAYIEQYEREMEVVRRREEEYASRGIDLRGRKYRVEKLIVTAYAPYDNKSGICNDGDPNTTATGTKPDWGTVAVNPKRFPYGTEFYIEGYGYGVGLDTGGAMRRNSDKIDLYMDTYAQAIAWGKREIEVIVFEDTNK